MEEDFSALVNYLWKESVKNISSVLSEQEVVKFSSNDYFYLSTIKELKKPNFTMIAESLGISKPAVSVMIRKLLSMGLVEKQRSMQDRRVTYILLTEKGEQIIKGDHTLYENLESHIKSLVHSERELQIIQNTIRKLAQSITNKKM